VGDTYTEKCHETYEPCEELETVNFSSDPEKYFKIGRELSSANRTELINFLTSNIDVFAWDPYEVLRSRMIVKLKIKLDLSFGQPKGFLSAKVQDNWQVKNKT
jgi:hypothetical protein